VILDKSSSKSSRLTGLSACTRRSRVPICVSGCGVGLLITFNVKWLLDGGTKRIVNGFPD